MPCEKDRPIGAVSGPGMLKRVINVDCFGYMYTSTDDGEVCVSG